MKIVLILEGDEFDDSAEFIADTKEEAIADAIHWLAKRRGGPSA